MDVTTHGRLKESRTRRRTRRKKHRRGRSGVLRNAKVMRKFAAAVPKMYARVQSDALRKNVRVRRKRGKLKMMTPTEIDHAAMMRIPLIVPNTLTPLMKPMRILGLNKRYRSEENAARYGSKFYYEVVLADPNGRSQIVAGTEQVEPYDRDEFNAVMARFEELKRRREEFETL